ncbi:hypothetical protein D3C81_2170350 [compost metagenome]
MPSAYIAKDRSLRLADFNSKGTAGMEFTAGRRIGGTWNIPFQYDPLPLKPGNRYGHRREQRLGVRMQRMPEQLVPGSRFHHRAKIHHPDPGT